MQRDVHTGNRDSHLAECLFQSKECPFRKLSGVDCPWTGILSHIAVHLVVDYENETAEMAGHFMVEMRDFAVGRPYRRAVFILGELFVCPGKQIATSSALEYFTSVLKMKLIISNTGLKLAILKNLLQ